MELEIKHLAPYLPYGLKLQGQTNKDIFELGGLDGEIALLVGAGRVDFFDIKPILKPLGDLTKEQLQEFYSLADMDMKLIDVHEWIEELAYRISNNEPFMYSQFALLLKCHFDIFGLIDAGLAIDINTIK